MIFQIEYFTTKPKHCILQKMAKMKLLICSNRERTVIVWNSVPENSKMSEFIRKTHGKVRPSLDHLFEKSCRLHKGNSPKSSDTQSTSCSHARVTISHVCPLYIQHNKKKVVKYVPLGN